MEDLANEEPKIEFDNIKKHVTDYLKNRLEYFKLSVIEYIAKVAPSVAFVFIVGIILLVFWVFANITAAIAIGSAMDSMAIGFLIISVFNLLLALFLIAGRKKLILKPVSNWIVKILIKSLEADENN